MPHSSSSIIVILPKTLIEIPLDSNLSWLTLFYAMPKELVEKRPAYLELPRNIYRILESEKYMDMIKSDAFVELVWDCYAWSVWQYFQVPGKDGTSKDIPGDWQNYSGDFPLWRLSYEILKYFRHKFETELEWGFQRLFLLGEDFQVPCLDYKHFGNMVGNLTDLIVKEQNWQPMIDEMWNNRQPDDYTGTNINKRDFMRSWTHSRTAKPVSLEELMETGESIDGETLYDVADPREEFETKVISEIQMEQFKGKLTDQDRQILQMRYEGHSLQEIADAVGFKTPSAVSKHIEKIVGAYENFISDEYGSFLEKHTK